MRKYLFIILTFFIGSCQSDSDEFEIGVDLVKSKTEISMVDSFTVQLSTVLMDSIPTSGTDIALVGYFEDNTSGSIELNTYLNYDLSENISGIDDDAIFDSITIKLNYADYLIGDSTQIQHLGVYQLTEELKLRENDYSETSLYNTSNFAHEDIPCGQISYYPHAYHRSIEIRLNDELGKEIIQLVLDDADEVSNNEKFNSYLKGFILKPTDSSGKAIVGFTADSLKLYIYTHEVEFESTEVTYEFNISDENNHFNQTIPDRSGTYFDNLNNQREEIRSTVSGNKSYIQGSSGVLVRLDFPTLNEIFTLEDRVLLKAELILRPAIESFQNDLPQTLSFYETDKINKFGDQVSSESDGTAYNVKASLVMDELYNENSYYAADISSFILSELSGYYYETNNGLLLTVPLTDFLSQADHLVLNGENASSYKPTLNLYFLTYE